MKATIQVGDLVISHTRWPLPWAMVGRPALVIDVNVVGELRLKVGAREWWTLCDDCEKV